MGEVEASACHLAISLFVILFLHSIEATLAFVTRIARHRRRFRRSFSLHARAHDFLNLFRISDTRQLLLVRRLPSRILELGESLLPR